MNKRSLLGWIIFSLIPSPLFMSTPAQAQSAHNVFSWSVGGSVTQILVLNNTTDDTPLIVSIGNKESDGPIYQGKKWGRAFGFSSQDGEIPIFIKACSRATSYPTFYSAPAWATNSQKFGGWAITDDYLQRNPPADDVKRRVEYLKKAIHRDLGSKPLEKGLDAWFKEVKDHGLTSFNSSCKDPLTLPALAMNWSGWYSNGLSRATIIVVRGNRAKGYTLESPRYVR